WRNPAPASLRSPASAALAAPIRCVARSRVSSASRLLITASAFIQTPCPRSVTEANIPFLSGDMTMRSCPRRNAIPLAMICMTLVGVWDFSGRLAPGAQAAGAEEAKPALKAFDPVLLTEGKEVKGRDEIGLTREGFRYVFVDAANKAK